ncbi:phosphodiester glycosidase family protein [Salinarimonas ramus]|uniref:Lipoprotein signal peptide n=1 Tax=Salinarimonas ramus TaxID=690164 RepID=A0A917V3E3_9HYPH|nr:phosphodiester glycosidase family protein [Salinarimonas ramus]GGK29716.1 lipoprotein signal peptide [Salinarimonas ramus]
MRSILITLVALIAAPLGVSAQPAPTPEAPCVPRMFDGARFTVCAIDPDVHALRLYSADAAGEPYGRFSRIPEEAGGAPLVFAMNAGMYANDLSPVGLHVEAGETLNALNTNDGPGNFHLLPNGVFLVEDGRARVMETQAYRRSGIAPDLATQSGPMLVIDGALHPRFLERSTSRKRRNGVGVAADGTVWFAISEEPVTFHTFGRLFRDELRTPDALFLDGGLVPSLYAPHLGRTVDGWAPLGPIVAAYLRGAD